MNKKTLKMTEKSILTSFRVRAAPKIWSKYTTGSVYVVVVGHKTVALKNEPPKTEPI